MKRVLLFLGIISLSFCLTLPVLADTMIQNKYKNGYTLSKEYTTDYIYTLKDKNNNIIFKIIGSYHNNSDDIIVHNAKGERLYAKGTACGYRIYDKKGGNVLYDVSACGDTYEVTDKINNKELFSNNNTINIDNSEYGEIGHYIDQYRPVKTSIIRINGENYTEIQYDNGTKAIKKGGYWIK